MSGTGPQPRPRPAEVWALACLYLGGSVGALLGALRPFSPDAPVALSYACSAVAAVVAAGLWLLGGRAGRHLLVGLAVLAVGLISGIVATAATTAGATLTAYAYLWVAIYAAHFFPRRVAVWMAGFVSVAYGVALLANDLPAARKAYIVVVGTIWAATVVLSGVVARLREQAGTDQLTGLLNRPGFAAAAARAHALAGRTGDPLTLAVLDLDGFKAVNDRSGHAAGDRMLADLSAGWRATLRTCDVLGRHGGDEFVLLLPATTPSEAGTVLERLRSSSPLPWSAGVTLWSPGESLDACLRRADRSLYDVKAGRVAGSLAT